MKLNIKSREQFDELIKSEKQVAESYRGKGYFNVALHYSYVAALQDVLDSWDEIYQAHRMDSAVQDAKNHLRDYIEDDAEYEKVITSGIPEVVAERFLDSYDCNTDENDQYESIIENILKENNL